MNVIEIIDKICRSIIRADDLQSIACLILDLAIGYTDAEKGSLMLIDNQGQLYIHSSRGFSSDFDRSYRVKIGEGIAGKVAQEQTAVLVTDISTDERFKGSQRDRYKTRSFISCPILGHGELLGLLNINDKKNLEFFTEDELELIQVLASQAALALKNAFLLEKYREKMIYAEDLNRKLIDADLAKTDFLTGLSHELRTPLNSIKGSVYYLKNADTNLSQTNQEFLGIIENEANRLATILDKQLDFLRLENENRSSTKTIIPITELLQEILESQLLKTTLSQQRVVLHLDPDSDCADIVGDRVQVGQIFINLLQGLSGQFSKGTTLSMSVREEDIVEILLQAPEKLPNARIRTLFQIKEDFGRKESTPNLKLCLVRRALDVNGWKIDANNAEQGFYCRVTIPKLALELEDAALDMTMGRVLEFVSEMLGVGTSSLMLCDRLNGDLVIRSARGLDEEVIRGTRLRLGDRLAGWVAAEGQPLLVKDIEGDPRFGRPNVSSQYSSKSLLSVPLKSEDRVIGVLNMTDKVSKEPFTEQDLRVAQVLVERISTFIETLKGKVSAGEKDFRKMIASLDGLLSAKNRYGKRASCYPELVDAIMVRLQAGEKERELAIYSALIYDLGLVLLDRRLLEKKKRLSDLELASLQNHPYSTLELLQDFEPCQEVKRIILHHHEHYDGSGYPDALSGEAIPLISRVLAVVDGYCAMLEDRSYRKALSKDEALKRIRAEEGRQYDPQVVKALEGVLAD